MASHTYVIYNLASHTVINTVKSTAVSDKALAIRTNARNAAGIGIEKSPVVWDKYGNEIIYTKKKNIAVHIIDDDKLAAGNYEKDPIGLLYDPARLAASRTRDQAKAHKGERIRQQHHAARIAEKIKLDGLKDDDGALITVTTLNAKDLREQVRTKISRLKQERYTAFVNYERMADKKAAEIAEQERQRDALTAYIRLYLPKPKKNEDPETYTADSAAQTATRRRKKAEPIPGCAEAFNPATGKFGAVYAPGEGPEPEPEPKGAFFDPAKYQMNPAPAAEMDPDECDFI